MSDLVKKKVEHFRRRFQRWYGDGHFFFACHAAFPIAFSVDMLYQLWANFMNIPESAVDAAQSPFRKKSRSVDRLAVSDLLQSGLCRRTDIALFEMETGVRAYLLEELRRYFPEERQDDLARFTFQYADRRIDDPYYRGFRDTQRWVALARLAPEKAGEQLAAYYNVVVRSGNSAEIIRLDGLLEAMRMMDARFADLREFSRGVRAGITGKAETEKQEVIREAFRKVLRIHPGLADRAGGIRVNLSGALRKETLSFGAEISDESQLPELRIRNFLSGRSGELDLSGLNLKGLPAEIFSLERLEVLDLSDNDFFAFPEDLGRLPTLRELRLDNNRLSNLAQGLPLLRQLKTLSLQNNQIDFLPDQVFEMPELERLDLRGNGVVNMPGDAEVLTREDLDRLRLELQPEEGSAAVLLFIGGADQAAAVREVMRGAFDRGALQMEAPLDATPWDLFRLCRKYRNRLAILHFSGGGDTSTFNWFHSSADVAFSLPTRIFHRLIDRQDSGRLCLLERNSADELVKGLFANGFDCCLYAADPFGTVNLDLIVNFYANLSNGSTLQEAFDKARNAGPLQQQFTKGNFSLELPASSDYQLVARDGKEAFLQWRLFGGAPEKEQLRDAFFELDFKEQIQVLERKGPFRPMRLLILPDPDHAGSGLLRERILRMYELNEAWKLTVDLRESQYAERDPFGLFLERLQQLLNQEGYPPDRRMMEILQTQDLVLDLEHIGPFAPELFRSLGNWLKPVLSSLDPKSRGRLLILSIVENRPEGLEDLPPFMDPVILPPIGSLDEKDLMQWTLEAELPPEFSGKIQENRMAILARSQGRIIGVIREICMELELTDLYEQEFGRFEDLENLEMQY